MSGDNRDGFPWADIDVGFLDDPKFRRLERRFPMNTPEGEGAFAATVVTYLATVLRSWKEGRPVSVTEASASVEATDERVALLQAVGLIDSDGLITERAWNRWFGAAAERRGKRRAAGSLGGIAARDRRAAAEASPVDDIGNEGSKKEKRSRKEKDIQSSSQPVIQSYVIAEAMPQPSHSSATETGDSWKGSGGDSMTSRPGVDEVIDQGLSVEEIRDRIDEMIDLSQSGIVSLRAVVRDFGITSARDPALERVTSVLSGGRYYSLRETEDGDSLFGRVGVPSAEPP